MVLECFTWIPHVFCSLISPEKGFSPGKGFGPLPDDIFIDILSRLPADSVLQCRRVCRHWKALTLSSYFMALQNRRAPSLILVQCCHEGWTLDPKLHFSVFDEHVKKLKRIHLKSEVTMREHNPELIGSCGALLIFRAYPPKVFYSYDFVLNLITQEQKVITSTGGCVCGIYIHPLASEFKFLWVHILSGCYRYYIYSFTSHVTREIASSPFFFRPAFRTFPAIVNLALHWIVAPTAIKIDGIDRCMHAIMVFRMESEDLYTLPHPRIDCNSRRSSHYMMHLFVKDNYLSLCHCRDCYGNVDIWILEDYENWHWVRRYRVNISVSRVRIDAARRRYFQNPGFSFEEMKVVSISKHELLIKWFSDGLYLIDLMRSTVQKIDLPHNKKCGWNTFTSVGYTSSVATSSLVSPMGNVLSIGEFVMGMLSRSV